MDTTFLSERITATRAQIVAYEDAITAIVSAGVTSYTLDTGQSRQTVTRLDLPALQNALDSLYSRLDALEARISGGAVIVGPLC